MDIFKENGFEYVGEHAHGVGLWEKKIYENEWSYWIERKIMGTTSYMSLVRAETKDEALTLLDTVNCIDIDMPNEKEDEKTINAFLQLLD